MAIIQNQAVIQKLIDELELYPSKDVIPTELAEKILPVFSVNSADVEAKIKPTPYLWSETTANDNDKTITVPDGHTYKINSGCIKYTSTATVGNRYLALKVTDGSGNILYVVESLEAQAASKVYQRPLTPLIGGAKASAVWCTNTTVNSYAIAFPQGLILPEGYKIQFYDV